MRVRSGRWFGISATLTLLAACASSSHSAGSATTAAATTTSAAAATTGPATTTPVTTPATGPAPGPNADWPEIFDQIASNAFKGGPTAVVANDPSAIAAPTDAGGWLLVDTSIGLAVRAEGLGQLIGVGAVLGGFVAVSTTGPTSVEVFGVSRSGDVTSLGSLAVPPSIGDAGPLAAHVVEHKGAVYILTQVEGNTAQSVSGPGLLRNGKEITPLTSTIYGNLTFTNDDALLVTGGPVGQMRTLSNDGGTTWTELPSPPGAPVILLSLSNDRVVASGADVFGGDPTRVDVEGSDGSDQNVITEPAETGGWLVEADPGSSTALLVGIRSGIAYTIDRATGALAGGPTPMFQLHPDQRLLDLWIAPDGHHQAVVSEPCANGCAVLPAMVINGGA
ncbi:MAG: hypothetical protein JWM34_3993 [Ilumatobacteraceae bacterium]|nr:hypothetical protein [Ilumatobacteraceae bacterium]